jgi:hypothetical protein
LRARFVARIVLGPWLAGGDGGDEAVRALHDDVDARAVGMSLAEIKAQQGRSMRVGVGGGSSGSDDNATADGLTEPLHAQQMKKLTKIDLGVFLQLAGRHHANHWQSALSNLKVHFRAAATHSGKNASSTVRGSAAAAAAAAAAAVAATSGGRTLGVSAFRDFLSLLQPNIDSRHAHTLYAEAMRHSIGSSSSRRSAGGEGVEFDDFLVAGGAQLLSQDYLRQAYAHSDWSVLHGEQEVVSTVRAAWDRLQPTLRPFLGLAASDGSALSRLVSERLGKLEALLCSQLLALHGASLAGGKVRAVVQTFRDLVYEVYAYFRFRETRGAMVRVKGTIPVGPDASIASASWGAGSAWLGAAVPPAAELAAAPGPCAAHLCDELHALLFMLQRELEAFVPHENVPAHEQVSSNANADGQDHANAAQYARGPSSTARSQYTRR